MNLSSVMSSGSSFKGIGVPIGVENFQEQKWSIPDQAEPDRARSRALKCDSLCLLSPLYAVLYRYVTPHKNCIYTKNILGMHKRGHAMSQYDEA